jgi:uncharacterized integral membrane protein
MSVHRTSRESNGQFPMVSPPPAAPALPAMAEPVTAPVEPVPTTSVPEKVPGTTQKKVPATRVGAAWVALVAAAILAVLLIIFLAQNTRSTEISFLWMTTSTSLAVALLVAAVGSVLLTVILGTARITQLRRRIHRQGTAPSGPSTQD